MQTLDPNVFLTADSFVCGLALGSQALPTALRLRLVLAFGICDAIASAIGQMIGHPKMLPPALIVYLCCAGLLGLAAGGNRRILYALPVLLCIDNLADGASSPIPAGVASGAMAAFGMAIAAFLGRSAMRKHLAHCNQSALPICPRERRCSGLRSSGPIRH
jgi:hypothetical protein